MFLKINSIKGLANKFEYFFGEDQARYIIEIPKEKIEKLHEILNKNSVHFDNLGIVQDNMLDFEDDINLPIEELSDTHKYWLEQYMST